MSKASKKSTTAAPAVTAVAAPTPAPAQPATLYTVLAAKRPLTGLKFGAKGNAATHAALAAAATANGGKLTAAQAQAVCTEQNHKGFYSYAVNRLHILQVVA